VEQVEAFRRSLARHAATVLTPEDLRPLERVDAVVPGGALGLELAAELERLGPFGEGNREPTLLVPAARIEQVWALGDEGQHARITISNGGARARVLAWRTTPSSLAGTADEPHDLAVQLEQREWNGAVEPRVTLRAACPTQAGPCSVLDRERPFWHALRAAWAGAEPPPAAALGRRIERDRRGEGLSGVAGDLLSSGEAVLVLCADARRRVEGVERLLGGIGYGEGGLALASWSAFAREPTLAGPFEHLLALDPPTAPGSLESARCAPSASGAGFLQLAFGAPEVAFAREVLRAELDLRGPVTAVYRALRQTGAADGSRLEAALRGEGRYPRSPELCGHVLRVLFELGLADVDVERASCRLLAAQRTELDRSVRFRTCGAEVAEGERWLSRLEAQSLSALDRMPAGPAVAASA
jgi:single-stranded-DNA-specific exonuclease